MSNSRVEGFMWGVWAGFLLAYIVKTPDDADARSGKQLKSGEDRVSDTDDPRPLPAASTTSERGPEHPAPQVRLFRRRPTPLGVCN